MTARSTLPQTTSLSLRTTTIVGLISNDGQANYRKEVSLLTSWCIDNNLLSNVKKTKEMVIDFRRDPNLLRPLTINSSAVERVGFTKFLGVHISGSAKTASSATFLLGCGGRGHSHEEWRQF